MDKNVVLRGKKGFFAEKWCSDERLYEILRLFSVNKDKFFLVSLYI